MLYASDCYASGPRSIGSSICTFIRTCIWIFIFNLEIPYEIFFKRSPRICCPYLFMVPDPDMELEWAMPSPMLLVFKPKHLWSVNGKGIGSDFGHGPGLGIGFGSIGPGYSIDDSGIGIYGSTQAGNVDLNPEAMVWQWILHLPILTIAVFPPFLEPASVAQVDLVAGAAVALPVVPIPIG